jgi:hypothetical protein
VLRERFELDLSRAAGIAPPGSQEAPAGERPLPPPIPIAARQSQLSVPVAGAQAGESAP